MNGDKGQRGYSHRKGHSDSEAREEVLGMVNGNVGTRRHIRAGQELCRGLLDMVRGPGSDPLGNGIGTQNYTERWGLWRPGGDSKEHSMSGEEG